MREGPLGQGGREVWSLSYPRMHGSAEIAKGRELPDFGKPDGESDYYFIEANEPELALGRILELVRQRIPKRFDLDPIRDIQILCPMNRGGLGARSLNLELQKSLNPPEPDIITKLR